MKMRLTVRLILESLEDRSLPAAPPAGFGPLPSVTLGLTQQQIDKADAVINWNATALRAAWIAASSPVHASRVYAMVSTAVYDAVNAIRPVGDQYPIPGLTGKPKSGASAEAAAIAAADTVLRAIYPAQISLFDAEYNFTMNKVKNGTARNNGIAWGVKVAQAVLDWRSVDDIRANNPAYVPSPPGGDPGAYQLTPFVAFALAPQWGTQQTWAISSGNHFLPPPPPALDSEQYGNDFNEVKSFGDVDSVVRTADQTEFAHFWADVPGNTATPPGHMNEIAEHISLKKGLSLEQNARLFGMLNIGLADAAINCWQAKYTYNLWRPVTAITDSRANDINPLNESDPTWVPLWRTPGFPSYTSGHSTFSGTTAAIMTSMFGPDFSFVMGSDDMPGTSRHFDDFLQAAEEAAESRLMGGIHFRFDNEAGLHAGLQIGNYVAQNFMNAKHGSAFVQIDPSDPSLFNLFVTGSNSSDHIDLQVKGSQYSVTINGRSTLFNMSGINSIVIEARDGNDHVHVSKHVNLGCEIYGGNGNDHLYGGSGHDLIFGGDGRDHLDGKRGNDWLYGGLGHDLLHGGPGTNHLFQ